MEIETISIPKPKVNPNEKVLVKNYRRKDVWELAIVTSLSYSYNWGSWYWKYDVTLLRTAKSGYPLRLYVGDDKIKKMKNEI